MVPTSKKGSLGCKVGRNWDFYLRDTLLKHRDKKKSIQNLIKHRKLCLLSPLAPLQSGRFTEENPGVEVQALPRELRRVSAD